MVREKPTASTLPSTNGLKKHKEPKRDDPAVESVAVRFY